MCIFLCSSVRTVFFTTLSPTNIYIFLVQKIWKLEDNRDTDAGSC